MNDNHICRESLKVYQGEIDKVKLNIYSQQNRFTPYRIYHHQCELKLAKMDMETHFYYLQNLYYTKLIL